MGLHGVIYHAGGLDPCIDTMIRGVVLQAPQSKNGNEDAWREQAQTAVLEIFPRCDDI